jgi:catechol 2,3-dioxygenase-like lactoylglutathione lyase family enzyme
MIRTLLILALALGLRVDAQDVEPAHFHHVHLNVTDTAETLEFYQRIFGAVDIEYAETVPALFTERSFILLTPVASAPPWELRSGIWHIGWGGIDVPHEYEWFKAQGVKIHTPLYALRDIHVTYLQGPDDEVIEVNTMGHHRFAHVHLLAADVNATTQWYREHLGVQPRQDFVEKPDLSKVRAWSNAFRVDNVSFIVYGMPNYEPTAPWWPDAPLTAFEPTDGRAIDHIAFSYRDIHPVYDRLKSQGVEIVYPIRHDPAYTHESFFIRGPDKVLIEIVEAKPVPEGIWDE